MKKPPASPTDAVAGQAAFAGLTRWPVTISYFEQGATEKSGEQTPVYAITFELAARIAQRVAEGQTRSGFQTPAVVFGEDFILDFPGCVLQTLD